jgi:hypothetical protein
MNGTVQQAVEKLGFVSGHDFSRAAQWIENTLGFSP